MWQVQLEIAVETEKDPLDPSALGVRYTEIELICRDLRDLANTLQKQNLALLTDAQTTKIKVLEEALKLAPVLAEAQNSNLLGAWTSAPSWFSVSGFSVPGSAIGRAIFGCSGAGNFGGIGTTIR